MQSKAYIDKIIEKLKGANAALEGKKVFVGFDGFVDRVIRPVKSEQEGKQVYFSDISEFASYLQEAAGKSAQVEVAVQEVKLGGNAPIMANAMGRMGIQNTLMASLGKPDIHESFNDLHPNCQKVSVIRPGFTDAFEFRDGKIMFSDVSAFHDLDWEYLHEKIGKDPLIDHFRQCELVALVDWSNLKNGTALWQGVAENILPELSSPPAHYFFDLADPSRKTMQDIRKVTEIIHGFTEFGDVTLGINENEACKLYSYLSGKKASYTDQLNGLSEIGQYLYDYVDPDCLLIHPVDKSILVTGENIQVLEGRYIKDPIISTGAGDNLNAGYCLGKMAGFSAPESAVLGMAASGCYVKYGKSPDLDLLVTYLQDWKEGKD
jgi:hypothetical protein